MSSSRHKYCAYYRVSTNKQGLGLKAQENIVQQFLNGQPEASFKEKESGKSDHNRPELKKALDYCKKNKAQLIVATLSRLSRDLHFITSLQKARIPFKVCDMPEASPLTIQIMGAIAEYERKQIGERTSKALQVLKKQGKKLGAHNPRVRAGLERFWKVQRAGQKYAQKKRTETQKHDMKVFPLIKTLKKKKYTYTEIAEALNDSSIPTRQGSSWSVVQVHRVAVRNGL